MIYLHKISLLVLFIFLFSFGNLISQENIKTDTKKILELIEKFGDKNPWANGDAINELVNIGEPAVNYLIKSLQDENENIRWCSAIAI
ncbi:MAG: HEAT repeat domain-containing protein, partial [Ignavibacteriota bacterium]